MAKRLFTFALLCSGLWSPIIGFASVTVADDDTHSAAPSTQPVNPVIE